MQRDLVVQQLKEESKKVEKHLFHLEQDEPLTRAEAEQFLIAVEKLYRNLAVYAHILKNNGDLEVHLKIMQNVPLIETHPTLEKKEDTIQLTIEETLGEIMPIATKETSPLKGIEFSINDKYRIINELFSQS
ncbi:MAG: hypothetical protein ACYDCN_12270 [Bacteroidia bacterium]